MAISLIARLFVKPLSMESRCKYVIALSDVAMMPPKSIETLIRYLAPTARTLGDLVLVSASSRARSVWTATAIASQI